MEKHRVEMFASTRQDASQGEVLSPLAIRVRLAMSAVAGFAAGWVVFAFFNEWINGGINAAAIVAVPTMTLSINMMLLLLIHHLAKSGRWFQRVTFYAAPDGASRVN